MIAVTQNAAPDKSAVPLGAGVALPAAAAKEVEFWQVMALADAAVVDTVAADPEKPALVPSDTSDKPDQPEPNTEQTLPDSAAPSFLLQFLVAPPLPTLGAPVPNVAVAMPVAPPLPSLSQAEPSIGAVPKPAIPTSDQAKPALNQPSPKANDAAGTDILPQTGSTAPAAPAPPEPGQPTALARAASPRATPSTANRARQASTLSDDPNTAVPLVADSRRSDTLAVKRGGVDLTNMGVAGTVSKPQATQIPTINPDDETPGTTNESPKPPIRPTADTHMLSRPSNEPPKPDAPRSTVENAWRQKWIGTDQPAVTEDVVLRDAVARNVLMGEPATTPTKGMSFDLTDSGASQPRSGKLAVAAVPRAPTTAEPDSVPSLPAGKTTVAPPDATVTRQAADASTVQVVDAKPPEGAIPDQRSFEAPSISAAIPPTSVSASPPIGPPTALIAPGIPPALTPTIIEMTKSGDDGPLELALSPEELGQVTISIRQEGDFVQVTLAAERPETLDLLRRHSGDLVADLRQSGFSGASLSFGHGDQGQPTRFAESPEDANDQSQPSTPETRQPAPSRSEKGSGMDLRF